MTWLDWFVDAVVIANAAVILLTAGSWLSEVYEQRLVDFLAISSWVFVVEIVLRLVYQRGAFWRSGWNIFDLVITAVSTVYLLPGLMSLRLLRAVRLVRLFRLFSINAPLRSLTASLVVAFPRVVWTSVFFFSLFTVYATIGIDLYAESHPEFFGTVGQAFFSLFQVMTLESWATGIAREVMAGHEYAWLYFVSFILFSTYILLNLLLGVITSSTIEAYEGEKESERAEDLHLELKSLSDKLDRLEALLRERKD